MLRWIARRLVVVSWMVDSDLPGVVFGSMDSDLEFALCHPRSCLSLHTLTSFRASSGAAKVSTANRWRCTLIFLRACSRERVSVGLSMLSPDAFRKRKRIVFPFFWEFESHFNLWIDINDADNYEET